jgi:hypothetical protein
MFLQTSPDYVKILRQTGRVVGAPLRGLRAAVRQVAEWTGAREPEPPPPDPQEALSSDLLVTASELRNRLMDDALIVRVSGDDDLYRLARGDGAEDVLRVEPLSRDVYNLHFRVPDVVQDQEAALLAQDWEATLDAVRGAARDLVGLPRDIEDELRASVIAFRRGMNWRQRLRETFFASLSALPPLLGVTYTLLTADPVSGGGIWIHLESLFGLNDLWALVSIPASAGLGDQERKQLERMIAPVFRLWLERRTEAIVRLYRRTVCSPIWEALEAMPAPDDARFARIQTALDALGANR